ncbi:type II secretion system protein [Parahaliea aestuarii]|uniref:Prepilin-type N-terminal cleavage/methylation domain-containing protein n=1 Tax=Parahaliea aestuarii TaxID=1852021 RepID=A0A5C8ZNL0_9GAMM|nr:prepilin-type N-terminal cleavage/methylation domain-containing protein [Parahaliea aestuarii]TXS90073.1 prepilin-type N-terminal cleavage/methylation domain-containing protein [Parahaliea aestuarii]
MPHADAIYQRQSGFSLLEMVVAIAILALSLGALYQAISGATRNVRTDEHYAFGVELARSLVADSAQVPIGGRTTSGRTDGGFLWQVQAQPLDFSSSVLQAGQLQRLEVRVAWQDGSRRREIVLDSVVEGRKQP